VYLCFITSNYTFTISNMGPLPAVLVSLTAITTPFGAFDLTGQVNASTVPVGEQFVVYLPIEIDLTVRQRYTVLATITGNFAGDSSTICSNSDFLDFIAGNALPPSVPTRAPTESPTRSPAPTVDPEFAACSVDAEIECAVVDGGRGSCGNFVIPATSCTSEDLQSLRFKLTGGTCATSTAMPDKTSCDDSGDLNGDSFQVVAGDFSGAVERNGFFTVTDPGNKLAITISSGGTVLQEQEIETRCRDGEDLTVGKTFGALQLVSFTNGSGENSAIVNIQNNYIVRNPSVAANVVSAVATTTLTTESGAGNVNTQVDYAPFTVVSKGVQSFQGDVIEINLAESNSFTTTYVVEGAGAVSGQVCSDSFDLSFTT